MTSPPRCHHSLAQHDGNKWRSQYLQVNMKILSTILIFAFSCQFLSAAQIPVGNIADDRSFAVQSGGQLKNQTLANYDGSILVVMIYTPWCSICQSNASSAGLGLAQFYKNPTRGDLQNKNANGVPVRTLILSTEPTNFDSTISSFADTNGYSQWGLDANASRNSSSDFISYFHGGLVTTSDSSNRRRIVVLNLVKDSPTHQYRQILINQNSYSSSENTSARSAINAVRPMTDAAPIPPVDPPVDLTPDVVKPSVSVASKVPKKLSNTSLSLSGTADDNVGVTAIYVERNGKKIKASGTQSWRISLPLKKGTNSIRVYAVDQAENESDSVQFKVKSKGKR